MTKGEKTGCLFIVILMVVLGGLLIFNMTPTGRGVINTYFFNVQKVDDATNYETRKKVEDTCHAMISSYTSDKMVYEQYHGSENEEERSWAEQAKMRANKTASTYNNFILENSFVWKDNVPSDICMNLEYLN